MKRIIQPLAWGLISASILALASGVALSLASVTAAAADLDPHAALTQPARAPQARDGDELQLPRTTLPAATADSGTRP